MPLPSVSKAFSAVFLASSVFRAVTVLGADSIQPPTIPITVHEWGTFTSVAGNQGESVSWAPLAATSDLPCFVHRLGKGIVKFTPGLVRMETPVVYFYAPAPTTASIRVDFPQGWITEWYPKATRVFPDNPGPYGTNAKGGAMYKPENGSIDWTDLKVSPGTNPQLPTTNGPSRYFAARAAESAPVQSGDEDEKLLFYRGIANFKVPVEAALKGDVVAIRNTGPVPISLAVLFENQHGRVRFRVANDVKDTAIFNGADSTTGVEGVRGEMTRALERAGLYPKEAAAMVETWRDSWFEKGMRVFYLVPRATVDELLPLKVSPAPRELRRVFVGRVEMLSPWREQEIRTAMRTGDTHTLLTYGRFLSPFLEQMREKSPLDESPAVSAWVKDLEGKLFSQPAASASCVQ